MKWLDNGSTNMCLKVMSQLMRCLSSVLSQWKTCPPNSWFSTVPCLDVNCIWKFAKFNKLSWLYNIQEMGWNCCVYFCQLGELLWSLSSRLDGSAQQAGSYIWSFGLSWVNRVNTQRVASRIPAYLGLLKNNFLFFFFFFSFLKFSQWINHQSFRDDLFFQVS